MKAPTIRLILVFVVLAFCLIAKAVIIDLSTLTSDSEARDGDVLTGISGHSVVIQPNATVILHDAQIATSSSSPISCAGSATVLLAGENRLTVNGWCSCAGLEVSGDSVLRISNLPNDTDASLCVTGGVYSAGIGCSDFNETWTTSKGGTIIIDGGRITAVGGGKGIGIGGGGASGKVIINGGEINADGIGGGYNIAGGTVEIKSGVIRSNAPWGCGGIGGSREGGVVRIFGGTIYATGTSGIGGGYAGPVDLVEIYGGSVESHGSIYAKKIVIANGVNVIADSYSVEPEFINVNYAIWSKLSGIDNAWNEADKNGIHYVFYYVFDEPTGGFCKTPLIDICFDQNGMAIVKTPPVVNREGFALSVIASDTVIGTGNIKTFPLSSDGNTVVDESMYGRRFFRLKAEPEK